MSLIRLEHCGLALPVYGASNQSLKKTALAAVSGGRLAAASRHVTVVQALQDVSLELREGDRLGIEGHNGAGKTSLLRMLAGVYAPTSGRLTVEGTVTSLIDVTLGMDHEATGYENMLIRGLILGLSRPQILALRPSIAEFSGLGDYLDMPVRTYSSGMVLRLAFSTVTAVQPEILLMDEWLSVGDADFVERAEDRLQQIVRQASILVLASHQPATLDKLCNRRIHLQHGRLQEPAAFGNG
ncbi:ABC transporter ATP-binding protein [Frateuria aurantia]|uniref:ABC-type polysaccharide/polyol phosphate transport system, ATPase component n=1 Tax=Frateuria aurantia (strain ATCC 33424 / DSM 6220 / KCTC 2777 / LMG 1558 / NBRC 3245 / NCIMB 13370) TaxID=767434 RepID=H8L116_FRAAD|nr:ABC transporter ATP-binding protein [Frateuria aurantia]AFC87171.1 ABC-type polysaccharide/polyol phosphate transport system, ATPase component [Frateuria aurantia DSM 6220]